MGRSTKVHEKSGKIKKNQRFFRPERHPRGLAPNSSGLAPNGRGLDPQNSPQSPNINEQSSKNPPKIHSKINIFIRFLVSYYNGFPVFPNGIQGSRMPRAA